MIIEIVFGEEIEIWACFTIFTMSLFDDHLGPPLPFFSTASATDAELFPTGVGGGPLAFANRFLVRGARGMGWWHPTKRTFRCR